MPRSLRDTQLETGAARGRLAARGKPYYRLIDQGCHLGYRRNKRGSGTWLARRFIGDRRYVVGMLGQADDQRAADGLEVLNFGQAQAKAREWFALQARVAAGHDQEQPSQKAYTVEDAMTDYLAWYGSHRKAVKNTEYVVHTHILPSLGKIDLAKLTTTKLRAWLDELACAPARLRTRPGAKQRFKEIAQDPELVRARRATANRILTVLKAALNRAFEDGKVQSDDAWRRVKPFRGADAARVRYLQEDECRRLLNACPPDFRKLVRAALLIGCRYGELTKTTVADLSPDAHALLLRDTKSGKSRYVPLDDEVVAFLINTSAGRPPNQPIFLRADGMPWGKSHQARPLLDACKAARIDPPASFHILRHTWASHRIMKGMPLQVVAQVLGHADTRMVEKHYGHLAPSYVQNMVRMTAMKLGDDAPLTIAPLTRTP